MQFYKIYYANNKLYIYLDFLFNSNVIIKISVIKIVIVIVFLLLELIKK